MGGIASYVDGSNGTSSGVPYFYLSDMSTTQQDLLGNPSCSFTVTEAQQKCLQDAQDPLCVKVVLVGKVVDVGGSELDDAKAALLAKHPEMRLWPLSHSWHVRKLAIEHVWVIDFFGGGSDVPVGEYLGAKADQNDVMGVPSFNMRSS